jgi:hypothetical protein
MVDIEIALAERLSWSLRDIDETDITSLVDFIKRYTESGGGSAAPKKTFADQVDWL